jgi:hypothetical protein
LPAMNDFVRSRVNLLIPALVFCLAVCGFLRDSYSLFDFPLDDGWIHRVYARSISRGAGFAYNDGEQEAGATSPLWCIVTAPAHWAEPLGTKVVVCLVKLTGAALALAAVLATAVLTRRISGSGCAACIAASLFAVEPRLLFAALSGMENLLLVALWAWACVLLLRGDFAIALALFSLTPLARPEALAMLPFSALAMMGLIRRRGCRVSSLAACALVVVPTLLWLLFCHEVNGRWLPNTYYVKASRFSLGEAQLETACSALAQHGFASLWAYLPGLVAFAGLLAVAANNGGASTTEKNPNIKTATDARTGCGRSDLLGVPAQGRFAAAIYVLMLLVAPAIYLLGVVGTRDVRLDGYYWTRWVEPASLLLTIPFCIGFGTIIALLVRRTGDATGQADPSRRRAIAGRLLGAAALGLLLACAPRFCTSFAAERQLLSTDSRAIAIMNVGPGKWIKEHTPDDAVVVVDDAGAIRYFGQRYTIDLIGLNNADIALGKVSLEDLMAKADWFAITPRSFIGTPLLAEICRRYEPRHTVEMPLEEYTICKSAAQTLRIVFQKTDQIAP